MGNGVGFVRLALFAYPLRPAVHGLVRPVVIASRQRVPALFGFGLPRWHQLPQGDHVDQHSIINVQRVPALEDRINALGKGTKVLQHVLHLGDLFFKRATFAPLGRLSLSPQVHDVGFQQPDLRCYVPVVKDGVEGVLGEHFMEEPYVMLFAK